MLLRDPYDRRWLPKHGPWIAIFLISTVSAIGIFTWQSIEQNGFPNGRSTIGLIFGSSAAALFVFEFLLWQRRNSWFRTNRLLGSAATWMRAHIWLGLLCIPLVVLHSGFRWGGWLTCLLVINFGVVIASGIIGLLVQQWLPRMLTDGIPEETIYSQIDQVMLSHAFETAYMIDDLCGLPVRNASTAVEAVSRNQTIDDSPVSRSVTVSKTGRIRGTVVYTRTAIERVVGAEPLRAFFCENAANFLLRGSAERSPLSSPSTCDRWFRDLRNQLPAEAIPCVDLLQDQCSRRRQLDRQSRLQFWLHSWLWVHLPLSVALLALTAVHAISTLRY